MAVPHTRGWNVEHMLCRAVSCNGAPSSGVLVCGLVYAGSCAQALAAVRVMRGPRTSADVTGGRRTQHASVLLERAPPCSGSLKRCGAPGAPCSCPHTRPSPIDQRTLLRRRHYRTAAPVLRSNSAKTFVVPLGNCRVATQARHVALSSAQVLEESSLRSTAGCNFAHALCAVRGAPVVDSDILPCSRANSSHTRVKRIVPYEWGDQGGRQLVQLLTWSLCGSPKRCYFDPTMKVHNPRPHTWYAKRRREEGRMSSLP
jgi:hypothetical protein